MRKDYVHSFERKMLKRKLIYVVVPTIIILLAISAFYILNKMSPTGSESLFPLNQPSSEEEKRKLPSSTVTSKTEVLEDGTTVITGEIIAGPENPDINKDENNANDTNSNDIDNNTNNSDADNDDVDNNQSNDANNTNDVDSNEDNDGNDASNRTDEDDNREKKEEDRSQILGNGEGDKYINQENIGNDIVYEKNFAMYSIDSVNVRMTPMVCDNIIDGKEIGERVIVVGESKDGLWFKIKYGDWYAYVAKEFFSSSHPDTINNQ